LTLAVHNLINIFLAKLDNPETWYGVERLRIIRAGAWNPVVQIHIRVLSKNGFSNSVLKFFFSDFISSRSWEKSFSEETLLFRFCSQGNGELMRRFSELDWVVVVWTREGLDLIPVTLPSAECCSC
jgi:hypothetical protein